MSRLRNGDHAAFERFVDEYKETVFMCCRRLGLREDEVEDAASETFMAAYKALRGYRGQSELSTWLWRIAYRKGIDYLRKNRRETHLQREADAEVAWPGDDGPSAAVEDRERDEAVWEAVQRLPRLWSVAVILHYREGKSLAEIANIMDNKENTVKTYLFRGRERLREVLSGALGEQADAG